MELTESIDSINRQLVDLYGIDTITGQPIWRVVFSEDQLVKQRVDCDEHGWPLQKPEVREIPKYRQWIKAKYILERLTLVPDFQIEEMAGEQISYECLFVFEKKDGTALPPRVDVCKMVIDTIYAAQGKQSMARYVDDYSQYTEEEREKRISELVEYLWDPSENADAIVEGQGIVVPSNYSGSNN